MIQNIDLSCISNLFPFLFRFSLSYLVFEFLFKRTKMMSILSNISYYNLYILLLGLGISILRKSFGEKGVRERKKRATSQVYIPKFYISIVLSLSFLSYSFGFMFLFRFTYVDLKELCHISFQIFLTYSFCQNILSTAS